MDQEGVGGETGGYWTNMACHAGGHYWDCYHSTLQNVI